MSRHLIASTLFCLALAPAAAFAAGNDVREIFDGRSGELATNACFARTYTAEHMKKHPDQNVTAMMAYVAAPADGGDYYSVNLRIRFSGVTQSFDVSGGCGKGQDGKKALGCGIDCDGGSLDLRVKTEDSIYIDIPDQVRLYDPDESGTRPKNAKFGSDDKVFRLDRVSIKDCLPIIYDDETKARISALKN